VAEAARIEDYVKRMQAQLWISHDLALRNKLKMSPDYYEWATRARGPCQCQVLRAPATRRASTVSDGRPCRSSSNNAAARSEMAASATRMAPARR
jgi:hypothetical protein